MHATLRLAGWSALAAGFVHLAQFAVLGIGGVLAEPAFPDASQAGDNYWFGVVGLVTFTAVAATYLVFFSAATRLAVPDGAGTAGVWRAALQSAAVVGIVGWLFAGASNLARRGFNATAVSDASGGDVAIGRAVLQGAYILTSTAAIAMAAAFAVWFVAFAVIGLRARTIGWGTATASLVAGTLPVVGWALNLGGVPIIIVCLFIIGFMLLRRARRSALSADPVDVAQ